MSYTLGVPSDAYRCLIGWGGKAMYPSTSVQRSHVLPVHVCIISLALHIDMQFSSDVIIKIIAIIGFQTYSKHIPSRRYVHPEHPSEDPCTSSTYFHHLTCVTYKHAVYMRIHHKNNCNHSFSNLFQIYPYEKLCTPYTSFRGPMYTQYIFWSSHLRYIQACSLYEMPW